MMRALRNKHNVKITSFVIAAVFVLGVGAYALMSAGNVANASPTSNIGVVDKSTLIRDNAALGMAYQEQMAAAASTLQKEFEEKSALMSEEEKQQYFAQMQQQFGEKQMEIQKNIEGKVESAVKAVADKKGLVLVVDKAVVLYGGVDISGEVQTGLTNALSAESKESAETDKK